MHPADGQWREYGRLRIEWREKRTSGPGVIESAFELLEILRALGRARLTELTAESALPRTTVYRLLGQLAAVGAVERIGAHYRLGPGLLALGQHVTPMERLRAHRAATADRAWLQRHPPTSAWPPRPRVCRSTWRFSTAEIDCPIRRVPGEPVPAGSAGTRVLTSGVAVAIDDSDSIDGVSCAAVAIPPARRRRRGCGRRRPDVAAASRDARPAADHGEPHRCPAHPPHRPQRRYH